jgi:vacuolar-type H+-ATPase subunit I/STV1
MTDEINPTGETPAAPVQSTGATDSQTTPTPPAATEEPFDQARAMATIQKLREIEKQAKQDAKEFARLKADEQKRIDANLSETEKLKKQADELAATNAKLQADILRRDVIAETGLPAAFAERLKGSNKDELLADAQELLKILPPQVKQPPHIPATNPNGANTAETEAQKRERLFGRSSNIFDPNRAKEQGGGVVWNK